MLFNDEWLVFSNFYSWFCDNYIDGYVLDKDILIKHNKEYSQKKCCFVPSRINSLFIKSDKKRGKLPIGVYFTQGKYKAQLHKYKENQKSLGVYDNPQDAFDAYKNAKEAYIKEVADEFKDKININTYIALQNYSVEITD